MAKCCEPADRSRCPTGSLGTPPPRGTWTISLSPLPGEARSERARERLHTRADRSVACDDRPVSRPQNVAGRDIVNSGEEWLRTIGSWRWAIREFHDSHPGGSFRVLPALAYHVQHLRCSINNFPKGVEHDCESSRRSDALRSLLRRPRRRAARKPSVRRVLQHSRSARNPRRTVVGHSSDRHVTGEKALEGQDS